MVSLVDGFSKAEASAPVPTIPGETVLHWAIRWGLTRGGPSPILALFGARMAEFLFLRRAAFNSGRSLPVRKPAGLEIERICDGVNRTLTFGSFTA